MRAFKLGRRSAAFARYALLLFDDRVEEVSYTLAGLEVKRFFFDEADFVTVHRTSGLGEAVLAVLGGAALGLLAFVFRESEVVVAWVLGSLAALLLVLAVILFLNPRYKLVLAAPYPETAECLLPRLRGRREEALGRLTRAVARYQSRTTRTESPRAEAAPAAELPRT